VSFGLAARMANVLSAEKRQQVIALGRLGWSLRRIEAATGVRRETASAYLKAAGVALRPPRRWGRPPKPANEVSTDSAPDGVPGTSAKPANGPEVSTDSAPEPGAPPVVSAPSGHSPTVSRCEPYRELIAAALGRGRNAMAIWQDLVDAHAFPAGYTSVMRFVRQLRGPVVPEAHAIIQTPPGEEGQVDYGEGPMVRDPQTRKYRRTRLFVFTLGYSRKSVRLLTWRSSTRIWAEVHERAFRRLGGCPRVVILDNLREGVLQPDLYDPTLNPLYRDVLAHYGVTALPCRVRDPDRKGKVESGIGHTQRTPLKGLRFEALAAAQAYLDHWDARWADTRIHGTTKRQVAAMFAEERPHLQPLPPTPFRYYAFGTRTVHLDGCVEVAKAYYRVPPGRIGSIVSVQWDERLVRILDRTTGALLREHERQHPGQYREDPDDRPRRTPPGTLALLARAATVGPHVGQLATTLHADDPLRAVRRIQGLLAVARKHGAPAVERACAVALDLGRPSYQFVRRYVERHPPTPLTLRQVDPLIRQLTLYRDLLAGRAPQEGDDDATP
jgi:transposase